MKKHLLFQVYKGKLNWKAMESQASIIKSRSKVMTALTAACKKATWADIIAKVGSAQAEEFIHQWVNVF
jgi:hypothetical protein